MLDQYALETTMLSVQLAVSLLSFVGSLMIISQVSRSNINRSTPQQRLILLISVCDIVLGICWIFNPLLMYNSGVPYWARGNQVTCSVQGFMIQLSILTGALYQASLQLQYLLGIKYGWTQRQLKNIEKYLHFVPLVLGLATAILNLVLKNYNPADWDCWIAPYPSNCTSSYELTNGEETDCVRGDNASIYQLACFFGPLWLVIGFCLFVMCQIYSHVYTVESRTRRYQFSVDEQMKLTKEVKSQSILYFIAFLFTWSFASTTRIIQLAGGTVHPILAVILSGSIASVGFWNALIYFKPRYKKCYADKNAIQKVASIMNATLFFWVSSSGSMSKYVGDSNDIVVMRSKYVGDAKNDVVVKGDSEYSC